MMGLTHLFVGTASALALTSSTYGVIPALIGGAMGGTISDIDTKNNTFLKYFKFKTLLIGLAVDFVLQGRILSYIVSANKVMLLVGIVLFFILLQIGKVQKHRGPTHSILALIIISLSIALFCLPIIPAFIVGFISHLILDLLNKKSVSIFFPCKGICLKLCYADKLANKILMFGSMGLTLILIFRSIGFF
ncbi:hypothetical protein AN639_11495 [Candidatus Epulonipiscium fishelsonii]|uniref:Uncharacterized protein n=1 Tax=Candidatus Epulonipiscium fishelsonii TaxID=77094 RepID=A0ACC8X863_9FIRM|nr:hypothetical protein AN396_11515 [Epulopiscium sp. SCG-B11WGA-EpuloA1]ONI43072.1 hypothetical protein AN639_11495 [Epulopiscium sp. SCG-B05WGA-EpuloA1]